MSRRNKEEETIVLSSFPLGINMLGFHKSSGGGVLPPTPPPPETFFLIMQDGSRYLQQDGGRFIKNG